MAKAWLGIDYGERRVGVAVAEGGVKVARPLVTLPNDPSIVDRLKDMMAHYGATTLVVGRPRGLDGQITAQTAAAAAFAVGLQDLGLSVQMVDEAVTSEVAAAAVGPNAPKGAVDAAAAAIILQDYLDGL